MASCDLMQVTGVNPCPYLMRIARRLVLVPTLDSQGNKNNFSSEAEVTKANIQAKLDEQNPLDRWYALPLMENVEDTRAETTFFEWNSGQKVRIREGTRTFVAALPDGDPQFLKRMQSWYGNDFGCYIIDTDGNFVYADGTGEVNPIKIDGNSFDVMLVKANDTEPFYIMVQFDFDRAVNDGNLRYVPNDNLDFDGRTSDLYGLLPLVPTALSTVGSTTTQVTVTTDYDVPVTGLTDSNADMYNVTDTSPISVTGFTEDAGTPGLYTVTHDDLSSSVGDTIRLTVLQAKYQAGTFEWVVT